MPLGEAIKARLKRLGWSAAELSRQSRVSSFTIGRMIHDEPVEFRLDQKRNVAIALGWSADSIDRIMRGEPPVLATTDGAALSSSANLDISDLSPEDQAMIRRALENARKAQG